MTLTHDYNAVTRWEREVGFDAVTIEPTGRVVFATFDHNPAMFAGVITRELGFDEVADGAPDRDEALWRAAAERLRAERRPGRTAHITVRLAPLGAMRCRVRPYDWSVDGEAVSRPYIPGPTHASSVDERPALTVESDPFVIVVAPGAHRLEGSARVFVEAAPPRDVAFSCELVVGAGEELACVLDLEAASRGEAAIRRVELSA